MPNSSVFFSLWEKKQQNWTSALVIWATSAQMFTNTIDCFHHPIQSKFLNVTYLLIFITFSTGEDIQEGPCTESYTHLCINAFLLLKIENVLFVSCEVMCSEQKQKLHSMTSLKWKRRKMLQWQQTCFSSGGKKYLCTACNSSYLLVGLPVALVPLTRDYHQHQNDAWL